MMKNLVLISARWWWALDAPEHPAPTQALSANLLRSSQDGSCGRRRRAQTADQDNGARNATTDPP
jgi:hypothetical protein